jgi:hypothetical protein
MTQASRHLNHCNSRDFVSSSDAQIVMGVDEAALLRLWQQKRGEAEPDLRNFMERLGGATQSLNLECYERHLGRKVSIEFRRGDPALFWMSDEELPVIKETGAVLQIAFLPPSATETKTAEIYMARLQHSMLLSRSSQAVLSVITGDGRWFALTVEADAVYQTALIAAEKAFWRAIHIGKPPRLFGVAPRRSGAGAGRVLTIGEPADPSARSDLPTSIDKSELTIGEPRRRRDKDHLGFVGSHACIVCGRRPCEAHHLRFAQPRALGRKVSDEFTVPLCRLHHRELHRSGSETQWWSAARIDPLLIARDLWEQRREPGRTEHFAADEEAMASAPASPTPG